MNVTENLSVIQGKIEQACARSGRHSEDIRIIAVTKYVSEERTKEALEAGIRHIGENRAEGLLNKQSHIQEQDGAVWHFIGTLQTRKVKEIIGHADYIHSLDRLSLAKEINKRSSAVQACFVQVNASGEQSKHGLNPEDVVPFIKGLREFENLKIVGLMTMAPLTEDPEVIRSCFRKVKELQREIIGLDLDFAPCTELSMGMSNDYEIAIEEGSTFIRIGTALVG